VSRFAIATTGPTSPFPDPEAPLVAHGLRARGQEAAAVAWDADVDWTAYDLVVVRSPWDYFERLEEFLCWVDRVAAVTRIVNPSNVIRWNAHKGYLGDLGRQGVPVLPTLSLPAGAPDAIASLVATGWDDVVLKPAVDGGARKALRAPAASAEAGAHLERLIEDGDVIVQPFASGVANGEVSLVYFDGRFSHSVRKVPAAGDYRVQALHGGSEHPHQPTPEEFEVAAAALFLAPGELTYGRVDLIDVGGRPTLMELELIEPDLFLRSDPRALDRLVDAVMLQIS
jgi:glutathione synthase/RimK-type ligase-like ATP-grasp enzyme